MTSVYATYFDQCPRAFFHVRNVRAQTDLFAEAVEEVLQQMRDHRYPEFVNSDFYQTMVEAIMSPRPLTPIVKTKRQHETDQYVFNTYEPTHRFE